LTDGTLDGDEDGCEEGIGVGQSEIEGFSDDWLLGFALTDGDSEGMEDGREVGYIEAKICNRCVK
jgi:hypothetical protein